MNDLEVPKVATFEDILFVKQRIRYFEKMRFQSPRIHKEMWTWRIDALKHNLKCMQEQRRLFLERARKLDRKTDQKLWTKIYNFKNSERQKESVRRWQLKNPEKAKESRKRWCLKNKERIKQYQKAWYLRKKNSGGV